LLIKGIFWIFRQKEGQRAYLEATPPKRGRVTVKTNRPGPLISGRHYIYHAAAVARACQARNQRAAVLGRFPLKLLSA
jgi:hypothetical protein